MIEIILIAYLPALVGMSIIALSVLSRQKYPTYVVFSLLLFSVIAWLGSQAASLVVPEGITLWTIRLSVLLSNFMAPLFLCFAMLYPNAKKWPKFHWSVIVSAPAILLAVFSFLPGMVASYERRQYDLVLTTGVMYDIQTLYLVGSIVISLGILGRKYYKAARQDKTAILMLLFAFMIPLVAGIFTNYVWINNPGAQYFVPVTLLLTALIITYAMVKHQLFDVRLAAVRGAAYLLSLATLAGAYYVVAFVASELFLSQSSDASTSPLSIALALILAFVFQPVKHFFDRLTNGIFYRDNYDTDQFLARLGSVLRQASDLRSLLQKASLEISGTVQAEFTFFYVRYGEGQHVSGGSHSHDRMSLDDIEILDEYVEKNKATTITTDLLIEQHKLRKILSKHNVAITLPLTHDERMPSYLFVGYRRSRNFTRRDLRALETISNELVIAIQNALSVQEVKDINATLKQRINEATKELRASNNQLQRLDEAKDEFLSMASHQLRTPLTSVKGYLSMVLEGDVGKITTTQRQLLSEAFTSSERMVHLINDFLNVSRLQTGKFMLEARAINLAKVVGQEVDSLQTTAGAHSMKLSYRMPSHFPMLYVDESKIRQVVMNFIDNAIYYSKEDSTITISLGIEEANVILKVHDTGIGVPQEEQAHIFTKFFRATNARKQRPDGTGVGLFLAKKVIVAHGGSMLFESKEGEGSTFGFRLPVKKLSEAPRDNADELDQ